MRTNGMSLHKLPLFVWALFVTAILLLLSLPVLAGKFVPALNLAVCWELSLPSLKSNINPLPLQRLTQYWSEDQWQGLNIYGDNQQVTYESINFLWNLNDCAPELSISNIPTITPIFLSSYITGLIEGDGTIVVPKCERSAKGKLNYPSIQIVFHLKDFPLCQIIQKLIGHGTISKKKQSAAYILTINNLEGLIALCHLINGKMRGPKYYQLVLLISYLNKKSPELNLQPLGFSSIPLGKDSWLTGFIEADGSFQVRTSINTKIPRISLSFELVQTRVTHYGYNMFDLMNQIAVFLGVNLNNIRSERKHPQYRVRTSSLKTNLIIREYLTKFPLRSTKYLDYQDWARILAYFEQGTHLKNKEEIIRIKSQMNQRRTMYNWDHLQFVI
jgi:hypothetical protein